MCSSIKVLMVDDHQAYVEAVVLQAPEQDDLDLVGVGRNRPQGLALLHEMPCDVAAVGLQIDGHQGLVLVDGFLRSSPNLGVVVIGGLDEQALVLEAVELGVHGWASRADGPPGLFEAVRAVAHGESHLPADPMRDLIAARLDSQPRLGTGATRHLTARESDVLVHLSAGLSRREIGEAMNLSPNTIRTYIRSILRKLQVHSAPAAVALAAQEGTSDG